MSREERRAYQRMNKGRDPLAPPPLPRQTQERIERARQQRRRRGPAGASGAELGWGGRWRLIAFAGSLVVALLGLSVAWPAGMPFALIVGVVAGIAWIGVMVLFRLAQRRARQLGVEPRR